ncbi:hypothetical protein IAT38_005546 [Cryptococcus sp. DSM 104549]
MITTVLALTYLSLFAFLTRDYSRRHCHSQSNTNDVSAQILSPSMVTRLKTLRQRYDVPGLSVVLVASPDTLAHSNLNSSTNARWQSQILTLGSATLAGDAMDSHSLFSIASNTKLFTAVSIGLLIEDGTKLPSGQRLMWDTKMSDVLPEWGLVDVEGAREATVHDLLTMRTGVPFHQYAPNHANLSDLLHTMSHLPPSAPFRQLWQYNNDNYLILAHLIPTLTGISFPDFARDRLLSPLGMDDATFDAFVARDTGKRIEVAIRFNGDASLCGRAAERGEGLEGCLGERKSIGWWTRGSGKETMGGAGLIMSSTDITKWLAELLNPTFIPQQVLDACTCPHIPSKHPALQHSQNTSYGYGQWISSYHDAQVFSHYGFQLGQHSLLARLPSKGIALAVMNTDHELGHKVNELVMYEVLDELLGVKTVDWEQQVIGEWFENQKAEKTDHLPVCDVSTLPTLYIERAYSHPSWGTLQFGPVSSDHPKSLQRYLTSVLEEDTRRQAVVASMHGREDWYILLYPCSGNLHIWAVLQLHDEHRPEGEVAERELVRKLGSGEAWVDDEGMGMLGNWWFADSAATRRVLARLDPKGSAEVWFDRTR